MAETVKVKRGPKFTRNHQLAILLVRHLGTDGAIKACYNNQWYGVLRAIKDEQSELRLTPA